MIFVKPKFVLRLQNHKYYSEHQVVVKNVEKVTFDKSVKLMEAEQLTYVSLGTIYRKENPVKYPVTIMKPRTMQKANLTKNCWKKWIK